MLWLIAFHIIAFAAWMAGMWYLPRLMVYHSEVAVGSEMSERLKVMERRLLRAITTPAMIATIVLGIIIATWEGAWTGGWLHAKLALVLAMAATHGVLASNVASFAADRRSHGARYYRILNEVPTVLFIAIVILAVVKPF
jgi:putative membrane protein